MSAHPTSFIVLIEETYPLPVYGFYYNYNHD